MKISDESKEPNESDANPGGSPHPSPAGQGVNILFACSCTGPCTTAAAWSRG